MVIGKRFAFVGAFCNLVGLVVDILHAVRATALSPKQILSPVDSPTTYTPLPSPSASTQQPFQKEFTLTFAGGAQYQEVSGSLVVPSGSRLLILTVAGATAPFDTNLQFWVKIGTTTNGNLAHYPFPSSLIGPQPYQTCMLNATTHVYADPGTTVIIAAETGAPYAGTVTVAIAGFLTPYP
jgi:hypothetical protein